MEFNSKNKEHATIIQKELNEAGGNMTAVSQKLGISRDRIRTFIQKYDLICQKNHLPKHVITESIQRIIAAKSTWKEEAKALNLYVGSLGKEAEYYGFSVDEITKASRLNKWNGRTFGNWTVVDGTHEPSHVTVRCVCGTVKRQRTSNLLSGGSQSCGCIGPKENTCGTGGKTTIWTCTQTGASVLTCAELARKLDVSIQTLFRKKNKNQNFIDPQGNEWVPAQATLIIENTRDLSNEKHLIIEALQQGQSINDIANEMNINHAHLSKFIRDNDMTKYYSFTGVGARQICCLRFKNS